MARIRKEIVVWIAVVGLLSSWPFLSTPAVAQAGSQVIKRVLKPKPLNQGEDEQVLKRKKREYEKSVAEERKKQAEKRQRQHAIEEKKRRKKDAVDRKWKQIEKAPYTDKKKKEIMNKFLKDYDSRHRN